MPEAAENVATLDENKVKQESARILPIIANAAKADRQRNKAGEGIANSLIAVAIECGDRATFTAAVKRAEAAYKVKHKVKALPKTWVQCKSNIRGMFDYDIPFVDAQGKQTTYSACHKALTAARKQETAQAHMEAEKAVPEEEKVLRNIMGRILATGDKELLKECSGLLEEHYSAYVEQHPEMFEETSEDVEQEGEQAPIAQAA